MPASRSGIWRNPRHGTSTGYANYRCRCADCRAWNAGQQRKQRAKYPEWHRNYHREWYARHPAAARRDKVLRKYGLSLDRYDALLLSQDGACAICRKLAKDFLQVDHDHQCCQGQRSCGRCIRGLLCRTCNTAIGLFHDDRQIIQRVLSYLAREIGGRRAKAH